MMINGEKQTQLPATDRGLHYGDGLFETLAVVDGQPRLWSAHMHRLCRGCEVLGLPQPDVQALYDEAQQLCRTHDRAVLKIIISRGSGGRGYRPPQPATPSRLLFLYPWPDYPDAEQGIRLRLCRTPLGCNPALAGIKHLNRLEQVLARNEWQDEAIHEGVMCDPAGQVKEGTMSNLFWVNGGTLHTPDLSSCGISGIMREQVIALAQSLDIPFRVAEIKAEELTDIDELFLTNSLIGIWPVAQFESHCYAKGELSTRLRAALPSYLEQTP